ncbi:unnamed protein product [Urochloa humidicola]
MTTVTSGRKEGVACSVLLPAVGWQISAMASRAPGVVCACSCLRMAPVLLSNAKRSSDKLRRVLIFMNAREEPIGIFLSIQLINNLFSSVITFSWRNNISRAFAAAVD